MHVTLKSSTFDLSSSSCVRGQIAALSHTQYLNSLTRPLPGPDPPHTPTQLLPLPCLPSLDGKLIAFSKGQLHLYPTESSAPTETTALAPFYEREQILKPKKVQSTVQDFEFKTFKLSDWQTLANCSLNGRENLKMETFKIVTQTRNGEHFPSKWSCDSVLQSIHFNGATFALWCPHK